MKARRRKQPKLSENIGLRGGIEVVLRNAYTKEEIIHGKGENVVLYIGRDMLMTRAYTSASQTNILVPNVVMGSGSGATQFTHTGPQGYITFKTGGTQTTTGGDGSAQPIYRLTASWASTELNVAGMNSIWEFLLGFATQSTGSAKTPFLCRFLSGSVINATTSNELLITYTVSF